MGAIVTAIAGLPHRRVVIKHRHQPVGDPVAAVAGQHGRDVVDALALGNDTVMTTLAGADDLGKGVNHIPTSHESLVKIWLLPLPLAIVPSWQLAQAPCTWA